MTILFLTRHAESVWHAENRYAGVSDIALTTRGGEQADALAAWSAAAGLDAVYSSPLTRCVDTATPSARRAGLTLTRDERMREVDFGAGDGLTRAEMKERFPTAVEAFIAAPATTPLPGGEPGVAAVERALPALDDACAAHPAGRVLVVMHSTLMRLLLCRLLGIRPDDYRVVFPVVVNCALTAVDVTNPNGTRAALVGFNVPPSVGALPLGGT